MKASMILSDNAAWSNWEAWLRRTMQHMPEGLAVFAYPCQGPAPLLASNAVMAGLLERPCDALLGQGWWQHLPAGEARLFATMLERAARGDLPPPVEMTLPTATAPRRLIVSVSTMPPGEGMPAALLAIFRDVTAQREAERSLLETERLRAAADLSAEVAHALTNQLTVMAGALDLVQELDPEGLPRAPIAAALRAVAQSTALLRRLQALARHDPPRPEVLPPGSFLPHLVERLRPLLPETVRLAWEVAPGTPPLYCDPRHLETAMLSVMMNGLEPQAEGEIVLLARPSGEGVALCLHGLAHPGVNKGEDVLASLLSAAVSRRFAARSGGSFIRLDDWASFLLPHPGTSTPPPDTAARILIATEDVRLNATLLAQAESLGYRALIMSGEAALERLESRSGDIALLLIDSELPPPLGASALARAAQALQPALTILSVGEVPTDWPIATSGRQAALPWLPSLRDFAEALGASLGA